MWYNAVMNILKCPCCGLPLNKENKTYKCQNNHCFDLAKQGYVNLLLANCKKSKNPGDDKVMIESRHTFMQQGYFLPLKEKIEQILKEHNKNFVLDLGCGSGYFMQNINGVGVDISKDACKICSANNKKNLFVCASCFSLPFFDCSFDGALNIFAPKAQNEYLRVLKPHGLLIEVVPSQNHLIEIKENLYNHITNKDKFEFGGSFKLLQQQTIEYQTTLKSAEHFDSLLKMTPFYYTNKEKLKSLSLQYVTISFVINIFEKKQ